MAAEQSNPDAGRRAGAITRITVVGMLVNIFLSVFKIGAGYIGHSEAVIADGVHSLSDVVTDLAIIVGVRFWDQPPDTDHPYGHGRIETLVTLLIGVILGIAAIGFGYEAITSLLVHTDSSPGVITIVAALASLVIKEVLFWLTIAVAKHVGSKALVANAWHHRSDALSSIPVLVVVLLAWFFPSLSMLDSVGTLFVCGFLLYASWQIIWPTLRQLSDQGVAPRQLEAMRACALETPGVISIHKIRSRYVGESLLVDMHIQVDPALQIADAHKIGHAAQGRLQQAFDDVAEVLVHVEPKLVE